MTQKSIQPQKPIQRIAILISIVSFFGSTAFGAAQVVSSALNQPQPNPNPLAATVASPSGLQSRLQQQEQEYEVVLKQEPNNQIALEGLVSVRLQMKNAKGAIKPLEKLVGLNPGQQEYKRLLAQMKQESKGSH